MKRILVFLATALLAAAAAAWPGYTTGPGGYYKVSDGSGPYAIATDGTATLIGSGGSGGGGAVTNAGTFAVQNTAALPAGANLVGKVGIDQTTPGTTNKVVSSISSGGVASGAFASGALASGSVASGAVVDLGAQADSAAAGDTSTASLIALIKRLLQNLTTINTSIVAPNTDLTNTQTPVAPATATATKGVLAGGQYNSAGVTFTDGQQGSIQLNNKGGVIVGGLAAVGAAPAANPVSVAGVDGSGNKQHLLTKTDGTVQTNDVAVLAKIPTPDTVINGSTATSRTPVTLPDSLALTGTCTSACTNVVLFTQEMTGYDGASIQLTSAGVGATIQYQISEDNTTYSTLFCRVNNAVGSQSGSTRTAVGIDWCPRKAKWLRVQITGYSSGTVTVVGTAIKTSAGFGDIGINNTSVGIAGQAAHDAAINGAPVRTGGAAYTANPTAVATGDTANFITTLVGAQIIYPWSIPDLTWQYASAADVTDTTSTEMKAAVASTRQYITSCQFSNTDATVGTYVNLLSAAAVIGVVYVAPQTAATAGQNSLAVTFTPPLRGSNVNEAMNFQAVTTSAQLRVACQGFASTH